MSKRGYISRYFLLLKKIKQKPFSTFEEIEDYIFHQVEYLTDRDDSLNLGFSKRTFHRDLKEIRSLFGINIKYSSVKRGYFIQEDAYENLNFQRMLETFDLFNIMQKAHTYQQNLFFDQRRSLGTDYLFLLLQAAEKRNKTQLEYQKFRENTTSKRTIHPYALKEFGNRWYLIGLEESSNQIKTFGLDRIVSISLLREQFTVLKGFSMEDRYKHAFGIITEESIPPQDIILSFRKWQGNMVKTLAFHPSQEVIIDNMDEFRIRIYLSPTYDFINELLSWGEDITVIQPQSLITMMKMRLENALGNYK